jgi:hypothetical protein
MIPLDAVDDVQCFAKTSRSGIIRAEGSFLGDAMVKKSLRLITLCLTVVTITYAVGGSGFYCALSRHGAFSTVSCDQTALPQLPTPLPLNAHVFVQMVLPQLEAQPRAVSSLAPLRVNGITFPFPFYDDPPKHPPRLSSLIFRMYQFS